MLTRLTRTSWTVVLLAALIVASGRAAGWEGPADRHVGDWGDPQRVALEGIEGFDAQQVVWALFSDAGLILQADPAAPLDEFCTALGQRAAVCFQHGGRRDAKADVRLDRSRQRLVVTVQQGRCYQAGAVDVQGAPAALAGRIVEALTKPYPLYDETGGLPWYLDGEARQTGSCQAMWPTGQRAPFDEYSTGLLRAGVEQTLAEAGYAAAQFDVRAMPQPDGKTARLEVRVRQLGPPATIHEVRVTGCQKNAQQAVVDYLGFPPGTLLTRQVHDQIERRLWESGRFVSFMVKPQPCERPSDGINLLISVTEYGGAPRLGEPLSREEKALLKARDWMVNKGRGRRDMLAQFNIAGRLIEAALSPEGWLVVVRKPGAGGVATAIERALLVDARELAYYGPGAGCKWALPACGSCMLSVDFGLNDGADAAGSPLKFVVNSGWRSPDDGEPRPAPRVMLGMSPAFMLALAHVPEARARWNGNILTIATPHQRTRLDERDGRLLGLAFPDDGAEHTVLTFTPGAYRRRYEELMQAAAGLPNRFRPERPVSSLVQCLMDDCLPALLQPGDRGLATIATTLLRHEVFRPLDTFLVSQSSSSAAVEWLMAPEWRGGGTTDGCIARAWSLQAADRLVPRRCWLWTLLRELTYAYCGEPQRAVQRLAELGNAPAIGPVGRLIISRFVQACQRPEPAMAALALAHLTPADFREDYQPLLAGDKPLCQVLCSLAEVLADLNQDEAALAARLLFPEQPKAVEELRRQLRRRRGLPTREALAASLDSVWRSELRTCVEVALIGTNRAIAAQQVKTDQSNQALSRCRTAAEHNRADEALEAANEFIRLAPDDHRGYAMRGWAFHSKNDLLRAIADYSEAIRLGPDQGSYYACRGRVYGQRGDLASAVVDFTRAIDLGSKDLDTYSRRGFAYCGLKDFDRAVKDFTEALRLDPKNVYAYQTRGSAYLAQGKFTEAIADYTAVLQLDPQSSEARDNRTRACAAKAAAEKARSDQSPAVKPAEEKTEPQRIFDDKDRWTNKIR